MQETPEPHPTSEAAITRLAERAAITSLMRGTPSPSPQQTRCLKALATSSGATVELLRMVSNQCLLPAPPGLRLVVEPTLDAVLRSPRAPDYVRVAHVPHEGAVCAIVLDSAGSRLLGCAVYEADPAAIASAYETPRIGARSDQRTTWPRPDPAWVASRRAAGMTAVGLVWAVRERYRSARAEGKQQALEDLPPKEAREQLRALYDRVIEENCIVLPKVEEARIFSEVTREFLDSPPPSEN